MSRTKRNYHHKRPLTVRHPIWERTRLGIGEGYCANYDPRNTLMHGYDGASPQYYYECCSYPPCGWKENFQKSGRKHVKKAFQRARRQYHKRIDKQEMHYSE